MIEQGMQITFETEEAAKNALKQCGFSLGRLQRDAPRGIMHGDNWDIQKWRNLSRKDRGSLHGVYQRMDRNGPVAITLYLHCPQEPRDMLASLAVLKEDT